MTPANRPDPQGQAARGGALDLLRFLAALFVVVYHAAWAAPVAAPWAKPLMSHGFLATDFFLMLSGYVLGRRYGPPIAQGRMTATQFWTRRALRIWPAHLIVLAGFVLLIIVSHALGVMPARPEWFEWSALPTQAVLLQAWGVPGPQGWNMPTWSLSALLACYIVFPAAWTQLRRLKSPFAALAAAAVILMAFALFASAFLSQDIYQLSERYGVVRAAPLFLVGCALARIVAERPLPERACAPVIALACIGLGALQAVAGSGFASMAMIAAVIVAAGSLPVRRPSVLVQDAARVSFALFLTHAFMLTLWFGGAHALHRRGMTPDAHWSFWVAGILFALGGAVVFDRLLDQPSQSWIAARRRGPAAAAVTTR